MHRLDGRLSDIAAAQWPGATVELDEATGRWLLVRPSVADLTLGEPFCGYPAAQNALRALVRAEKQRAGGTP